MKLKEAAVRFWRNIEAFAAALAYDERDDIEARIRQLEADGQSQQARLLSLSEQVQSLSEQRHEPAGPRG